MREITYPLLLDGGLSNQLENQGCNLSQSLWTADMIKSNPEAIIRAHLAYIEAGAQCIITSSYQASIAGYKKVGVGVQEAKALILTSVDLALKATDIYQKTHPGKQRPIIAASIGPYGAYLADGSEYTGNYGISREELKNFHLSRIQLLDASNADILACETIPSYEEALALYEILINCKKQAWITFTCKDDRHISDGTSIIKCIKLLNRHPQIFALGVNCTKPVYISSIIKQIKPLTGDKKLIIYPNSGEIYHVKTKMWTTSKERNFNVQSVNEWLSLGVDIIGGCCRVGPVQIHEIKLSIPQLRNS